MSIARDSGSGHDPVLAAFEAAPVVEGSPEELAAFEQGLAEIRAGLSVPAEKIREMLAEREAQGE
jgi:predicted transcriptional regulator